MGLAAAFMSVALADPAYAVLYGPSLNIESQLDDLQTETVTYDYFLRLAEEETFGIVDVQGETASAFATPSLKYQTNIPFRDDIRKRLEGHARIRYLPPEDKEIFTWDYIAPKIIDGALGIAFLIAIMRLRNNVFSQHSIGTHLRRAKNKQEKVTFGDVAGLHEAKAELLSIVDYLKNPKKYRQTGGKLPKGMLLVGPPGNGKTLLARAVAGEAGVPFFYISGSNFTEMFVGVGAGRVRAMFKQAKKSVPCIVFIDEIDAVGRHRAKQGSHFNPERDQALNQFLVEMDGSAASEGVVLLAATNRPETMDPALLRPGRFGHQIHVSDPSADERFEALETIVRTRKIPLDPSSDLRQQASMTSGFSYADLANMLNEAALHAASANRKKVGTDDLDYARDKRHVGVERQSGLPHQQERRYAACRQAGQALVTRYTTGSDLLYKVSIAQYGRAMGRLATRPVSERHMINIESLQARLTVLMAGHAAETLVFGRDKTTSATGRDLREATDIAYKMVTEWGMSEGLGAVRYEEDGWSKPIAKGTLAAIDLEIRALLKDAHAGALGILCAHKDELDALMTALLTHRTLDAAMVDRAIQQDGPLLNPA